jgi:hypothetical protein
VEEKERAWRKVGRDPRQTSKFAVYLRSLIWTEHICL